MDAFHGGTVQGPRAMRLYMATLPWRIRPKVAFVVLMTGCNADLTLPPAAFHPVRSGKINALYECALPLHQRAPHRRGRDLCRGRAPEVYPLVLEGPLMIDFGRRKRHIPGIEDGALTAANPPTKRRLRLWKQAAITVQGRP